MSEDNEIKRINGIKHKNSGRGIKKGDATWDQFVVDIKESSKSFTLNKDVWAKITTDAIRSGLDKSPALLVVIGSGNEKIRLFITEFSLFENIIEGRV